MDESTSTFSNEADIAILGTIPWCNKLLKDPNYTVVPTDPRRFVPGGGRENDTFMTQTLAKKDAIRACLVLRPTPHRSNSATTTVMTAEVNEILAMCDLGPKLGASKNAAHGGFIATLLDHFMGLLIRVDKDAVGVRKRDPEYERGVVYVTLKLEITYRKAMLVPTTVAVKAWYKKTEGRKRWVRARIEDSMGAVFAEGETLYLKVNPKRVENAGGKL